MGTGIGETLRAARQEQGRSVSDLAERLRTRSDYLRALEDEHFEVFGGAIYAKGFLRNYATELGLDPQPLLDEYRRQDGEPAVASGVVGSSAVGGPSSGSGPPPWVAWVLVAVVVLAAFAFLSTLGSGRAPQPAGQVPISPPPAPVPSEQPAAEDAPEPDTGAANADGDGDGGAASASDTEEEAEPVVEGVEVLLALEESSWMRVTIDGSVVLEQTVEAGVTRDFEGEDEIRVRLGNAGGIRAQVNGEEVDSLGARGQVVEVVFTADGVATD